MLSFFFFVPTILLLFSKCPLIAHLLKEVLFWHMVLPWRLSAYPGHSPCALNTLFRSPTPSWKEFNPCLYLRSLPFHRHIRMLVQQAAQANHTSGHGISYHDQWNIPACLVLPFYSHIPLSCPIRNHFNVSEEHLLSVLLSPFVFIGLVCCGLGCFLFVLFGDGLKLLGSSSFPTFPK